MNENIDLANILKDCPEGFQLYSPIFGTVYFKKVTPYTVHVDTIREIEAIFRQNGKYFSEYEEGECTLFPSKEQRDWSKFKAPWYNNEKFDLKTLKPFDKVLVKQEDLDDFVWSTALFSHLITIHDDVINIDYLVAETTKCTSSFCIPYNEDTKHLVGTTDEAPEYYRYWDD